MSFFYILKNLIFYLLPLVIPSTIALMTIKKVRTKRKIVIWGNLILFILVIIFSIMTSPKPKPLQFEWTFYAIKEELNGPYEIHTLLGEGKPILLGLENKYFELENIPAVHSGEQAQIRIRLNRKAYLHIFHFDTTFTNIRQLFPIHDIQESNPIISDYWIEIPPRAKTWKFDTKPCLEIFLCYVSLKETKNIKEDIFYTINSVKINSANKINKLDILQNQITTLAPTRFISTGEYEHNLIGVMPYKVKTCKYQALNEQYLVVMQYIRHEF